MNNDIARCAGQYDGVDGEFGLTLRLHCIDCQRRVIPLIGDYWLMQTPDFEAKCPQKLEKQK